MWAIVVRPEQISSKLFRLANCKTVYRHNLKKKNKLFQNSFSRKASGKVAENHCLRSILLSNMNSSAFCLNRTMWECSAHLIFVLINSIYINCVSCNQYEVTKKRNEKKKTNRTTLRFERQQHQQTCVRTQTKIQLHHICSLSIYF